MYTELCCIIYWTSMNCTGVIYWTGLYNIALIYELNGTALLTVQHWLVSSARDLDQEIETKYSAIKTALANCALKETDIWTYWQ